MATVLASFTAWGRTFQLRLSNGSPVLSWDTPVQITNGTITYDLYKSAFFFYSNYWYGIIASTENSYISIWDSPNGIDWYESTNSKKYLSTRKSNGLYYADFLIDTRYNTTIVTYTSIYSDTNQYSNFSSGDIPLYRMNSQSVAEEYMNYISTPAQPPYTWQSVPSISGKNGISLLSIIKSSAINSGDAVSGASEDVFDRLEETTKISTLIQGISEETPIIYSDDVNYMSITPTANNTCTLKFYLHGSVIYTLTNVNINAYLSFLIDETNGIMKPSIIYEDS